MLTFGEADLFATMLGPEFVEGIPFFALCQRQIKRIANIPSPVAEGLEATVILVPLVSHSAHILEKFLLLS